MPRMSRRAGSALILSRLARPRLALLVVGIGLLGLSLQHARSAPQHPAEDFGIVSSDQILWVYLRVPDPQTQKLMLRFAFRDDRSQRIRPAGRIPPLGGKIAQAVALGKSLHVIYSDGAHFSYRTKPPTITEKRQLPDAAIPHAWAADPANGTILAIVDGTVGLKLPLETSGEDRPQQSPQDDPPAPSGDPDMGVVEEQAAQLALVRFVRGQWRLVEALPFSLDDPRFCWMVVLDSEVHVFFRGEAGMSRPLMHTSGPTGEWGEPTAVGALDADSVVAVFASDGTPTILTIDSDTGRRLQRWTLQDATLAPAGSLDLGASDGPFSAGALAACADGSTVALAGVDNHDDLWVGLWTPDDASKSFTPDVVSALSPETPSGLDPRTRDLLSYILLALVLLVVFLRRQEAISKPAPLAPGIAPATMGKRMLAFLLDLLISSPITLSILYPALSSVSLQQLEMLQEEASPGEVWNGVFWPWMLAASIYCAYTAVFELAWRASPGKRIVGCRVVAENGDRCSAVTILVRNLFRLVELFPKGQFLAAIILVILTRNRQRLGDLIARTLVVESVPLPRETTPDSPPPADSDA